MSDMIVYVGHPRERPEMQSANAYAQWVLRYHGVGPREVAILNGRYLWRSRASQTGV